MPFFYILPSVRAARDALPPAPAAAWLTDPLRIFGANLRHERTTRGLTQEQVADIAGIEASYYSRLERAVIDPGVRMVTRVASGLGSTPAQLMRGVTSASARAAPPSGRAAASSASRRMS